jgi:glycosyltransferase involved in cell wall biosynthesis
MKIVLTSHLFLPEHSGGTEILVLSMAHELRARGHEVVICTARPTDPDLPDTGRFLKDDYEGIEVHRYLKDSRPAQRRTTGATAEYHDPVYGQWMTRFLETNPPDLVHFVHLGNLTAAALDACRSLQIPTVFTTTDFWIVCPTCQLRLPDHSFCAGPDREGLNCIRHAVSDSQPAIISRLVEQLPDRLLSTMVQRFDRGPLTRLPFAPALAALSRRAGFLKERMNHFDRVVTPTRLMQQILVDHGMEARRIVHQPYGIRPTERIPRRPDSAGRLRVGFMGTLSEHKGAHVLIAALRRLAPQCPVELRIYGRTDFDLPYLSRLQALAAGDPRVHFLGTFPNERIAQIFAELDVLVVPSVWHENTPLVIYSAQAAACPVVATDVRGMAEAIDAGVNGLLFEPGDEAELARILQRLLDDRPLLTTLSANSPTPRTISEYMTTLSELYAEILNERREQAKLRP